MSDGDTGAKTSGFGIGELGQAPECDPVERAARIEERERAQRRAEQTYCHYCGMPAKSSGFFGEPACEECGG